MNTLTMIGGILVIFGLFIFSIRLMAYNRRKYNEEWETESTYQPAAGMSLVRILSILLVLTALAIIYLFGD